MSCDLVDMFESVMLRADGRINSAKLKSSSVQSLLYDISTATNYLNDNAPISQRYWHLKNGISAPLCLKCGCEVPWSDKTTCYKRYCTQYCAVTCEDASRRAHNTHKGVKHTEEQNKRQSERQKSRKHSAETKEKLSKSKQGHLNPSFGKKPWNVGLVGPLNPNFGKKRPNIGLKGSDNPQYGKTPSYKAGRGVWGKFNNFHFRSSLEMIYLIKWAQTKEIVISAESSRFRVMYTNSITNQQHTYTPDFYIPSTNTLIEIKPENLHFNTIIVDKFEALKTNHPHLNCLLVGFKEVAEIILADNFIQNIENYIVDGTLILTDNMKDKLRRNYSDIIRAASQVI